MMHVQGEDFRFFAGAGFVGLRSWIQSHSQRSVLRKRISHLCRSQPVRLRVCTDEVEIRIGGVRLVFSGGSLLSLELIDNPPATHLLHVVPHFLTSAVTVAVLRLRDIKPPKIVKRVFHKSLNF